ncbi:MAG: HAMP domain-containing histidine kinase [Deltaproteobacteria bacterium]|nr:HAMP domain-containing histidine kinase [Deltaproteobacteria bacterium]
MRLTLTRKVFLGYFLMIGLVLLEGGYAVFELNRLNLLSRSMVEGEVVDLNLEKKLIDLFLSEVGNEKKYLVVHDSDFLNLARSKGREFDATLLKLRASSPEGERRRELEALQALHERHRKGFLTAVEEVARGNLPGWMGLNKSDVQTFTERIETMIWKQEVAMARKMNQARAFSFRAYKITIGIVVSMVAIGFLTAWLLTRSIRVPIRRLTEGTRIIARGEFNRPIEVTSRDELGDLARAFNTMTGKLGKLEEMKREIISNVSHEFRTPLTSIKEATQLLQDRVAGPLNGKQQKLLGIIQEGTAKLVRLINNLLDLSRIRAGMMQYHFEKCDLLPILQRGMTNIRFLADLKRIVLELEAPSSLPPLMLDNEKVEEVVNNLLGNAVKFTPEGGSIRIEVGMVSGNEVGKNGRIRVCVEDNGTGIEAGELSRIFDRFRQVDPIMGHDPQRKGTGLGLSICQYYIAEHGGRIWAESEIGKGSRFFFELPLKAGKETVPA